MKRAGFTLLEIMFAITIFATAILTLMAGVSGAIQSASGSINRRAAREVCRAKVEEILAGAESPEGSGQVEEYPGFAWTSRVEELKVGVADRTTETVKVVTVEVTFPVDSQNKSDGSTSDAGEGMESIKIASVLPPEDPPQGTGQ